MFERFKRSSGAEAPTRASGVATAERPTGDPVAPEDRGIRRDSTLHDDHTTWRRPGHASATSSAA